MKNLKNKIIKKFKNILTKRYRSVTVMTDMNFAEFNLSTLLPAIPSIVFSVVLFLAAKTVKEEQTHHHA